MTVKLVKTGTLHTVADTVVLPLNGGNTFFIGVSGTYAGATVIIESSNDGTNYSNVAILKSDTNFSRVGSIVLGTDATRAWDGISGALLFVRIRLTVISSGTINVEMVCGDGANPVISSGGVNLTNSNVAKLSVIQAAGTGTTDNPLVTSGPGILHRLIVTTAGTAAFSIYDDPAVTSGKPLLFKSGATPPAGEIDVLDIPFANGLTVLPANGSAAFTLGYTLL